MAKTKSKKSPTMEELLAGSPPVKSFSISDIVNAKLLRIDRNTAYFDIKGGKSEGILEGPYFAESRDYVRGIKIGGTTKATVISPETKDGYVLLSLRKAASELFWGALKKAREDSSPIEVTGVSAGPKGVAVTYDTMHSFIPASQLGKKYSENPEALVGKRIKVKVIEVDPKRNRLLLSERAVSEAKSIAKVAKALKKVKEADIYEARVTTLTSFGAFAEIIVEGVPVEGLIHISEISWAKILDPKEVLTEGDKVKVKVVSSEGQKLALSIKAAKEDPWKHLADKYKPDTKVKGKVVRLSDFGAFVELEPGIEGLIHITKIPPGTGLSKGQEVNCYIEDIDTSARKIALGIILTTSKPIGYK